MATKKFTSKFNWDLHVTAQIDELQMIVKVTQPLTQAHSDIRREK